MFHDALVPFAERRIIRMRNTVYEMMQIIINMVEKDSLNVCRIHPSGVLGPQDYAYQWRIG